MSNKLYNPKAHAPAVYIPAWLIQVPSSELSTHAKILYGRLAQWSNEKCQVFRSNIQLSSEIGVPAKSIERHLKELRDVKLLKTFHPQAGGVNHFEFLHHIWMEQPIHKNLIYTDNTPPSKMRVPPLKNEGTPPSKMRDINKK